MRGPAAHPRLDSGRKGKKCRRVSRRTDAITFKILRTINQMIPLPPEFERVDTGLRARTMTGVEAGKIVFAARRKLGPPWHWKSWKSVRTQVLGPTCEKCGAGKDSILYVQHTFRVPRVRPYLDKAKNDASAREPEPDYRPALRAESYAIRDAAIPEMRDCCPKCSSLSIQYRKRVATWICNGVSTAGYCAHVFSPPAKKAALTADQKKDIRRQKYQAWRHKVLNREDDWMRDAFIAWIVDMRRYLSLLDTKTLCKRCAFLEDMTDAKPCRFCGFAFARSENVCPNCGKSEPDKTE